MTLQWYGSTLPYGRPQQKTMYPLGVFWIKISKQFHSFLHNGLLFELFWDRSPISLIFFKFLDYLMPSEALLHFNNNLIGWTSCFRSLLPPIVVLLLIIKKTQRHKRQGSVLFVSVYRVLRKFIFFKRILLILPKLNYLWCCFSCPKTWSSLGKMASYGDQDYSPESTWNFCAFGGGGGCHGINLPCSTPIQKKSYLTTISHWNSFYAVVVHCWAKK